MSKLGVPIRLEDVLNAAPQAFFVPDMLLLTLEGTYILYTVEFIQLKCESSGAGADTTNSDTVPANELWELVHYELTGWSAGDAADDIRLKTVGNTGIGVAIKRATSINHYYEYFQTYANPGGYFQFYVNFTSAGDNEYCASLIIKKYRKLIEID